MNTAAITTFFQSLQEGQTFTIGYRGRSGRPQSKTFRFDCFAAKFSEFRFTNFRGTSTGGVGIVGDGGDWHGGKGRLTLTSAGAVTVTSLVLAP